MKCQDIFSLNNREKKLDCCLPQILLGVLVVNRKYARTAGPCFNCYSFDLVTNSSKFIAFQISTSIFKLNKYIF